MVNDTIKLRKIIRRHYFCAITVHRITGPSPSSKPSPQFNLRMVHADSEFTEVERLGV
ncbi:hypothetical protein AKJ16_DCAP13033 [Drosera capensis]